MPEAAKGREMIAQDTNRRDSAERIKAGGTTHDSSMGPIKKRWTIEAEWRSTFGRRSQEL
jgi:hypothetical protein